MVVCCYVLKLGTSGNNSKRNYTETHEIEILRFRLALTCLFREITRTNQYNQNAVTHVFRMVSNSTYEWKNKNRNYMVIYKLFIYKIHDTLMSYFTCVLPFGSSDI